MSQLDLHITEILRVIIRRGFDEDKVSVALTVGIECDLTIPGWTYPWLHGRRGLPSERSVKISPFYSISKKWILIEYV